MRIFLAGATGVIGSRLTPLLVAAGHAVTGTTRSAEKARSLAGSGVEAVVVDVFDGAKLREVVVRARPDVVIHQPNVVMAIVVSEFHAVVEPAGSATILWEMNILD